MKKLITYLTMLSMILSAVPAAGIQAAAKEEAPAVVTETQEAAPADLAGRWFYQENGENTAYVMVNEDGTYSIFYYAESKADGGTVKVEYDEHPDGSKTTIYSFYENSDEFLFGCMVSENEGVLTVGQDGAAKLVKDTKDYESASPADMEGRFFYSVFDAETGMYHKDGYVTVSKDGGWVYCSIEGPESFGGTVSVSYEVFPDGTTNAWYSFINDETGEVFISCVSSYEDTYLTGNGGGGMLERDNRTVVAQVSEIAGQWVYQVLDSNGVDFVSKGIVTVYEDGFYIYQDFEATDTVSGAVTVEPQFYPNGAMTDWFCFYDINGEFWIGCTTTEDSSELAIGNGGMARLIANEHQYCGENEATPADIAGKWLYQPVDGKTAGYVTVDENGEFFYISNNFSEETDVPLEVVKGRITMHYIINPDSSELPIFKFYTEDGELFCEAMRSEDGKTLDLSQDGSSKMVRDESVRQANGKDICGAWILKEQNPEKNDYSELGKVTVRCNEADNYATYTFRDFATGVLTNGYVYAGYQMYPDGSVQICYTFYNNNGDIWFSCMDTTAIERNTLTVGQSGEQILQREEQIANDFGFCDVTDAQDTGISMAELEGEWKEDDVTLYIYNANGQGAQFAMYTDKEGAFANGIVKYQYQEDANGQKTYYYVLYAGENVYLVFTADGQSSVTALKTDDDQPNVFVRGAEPVDADSYQLYDAAEAPAGIGFQTIAGAWKQDGADYDTILTFENCSEVTADFTLTSADGSKTEGIAKLQYSYDLIGGREYLYVLYVADETGVCNQIFMTVTANAENAADELVLSNMDIRFMREVTNNHRYSFEQLIEMAKTDYRQRTGVMPAGAKTIVNADDSVTIVLKDENGEDLDAYTVDPDTGIGERFSDESAVNLPQTGNNSLKTMLLALSAFLISGFGLTAVRKSGIVRRKADN